MQVQQLKIELSKAQAADSAETQRLQDSLHWATAQVEVRHRTPACFSPMCQCCSPTILRSAASPVRGWVVKLQLPVCTFT